MKIDIDGSATVFLGSMFSMSLFLALSAWFTISGELFNLFVSSLAIWLSYLSAHKTSEGAFVDGLDSSVEGKDPKMTPKNSVEYIGSITGFAVLASGMGIGSIGLGRNLFALVLVGSSLFITGYVIAHISTTGELL